MMLKCSCEVVGVYAEFLKKALTTTVDPLCHACHIQCCQVMTNEVDLLRYST